MGNYFSDHLLLQHSRSDHIFLERPGLADIRYREYLELTGRMANAMIALNIRPDDRIAIRAEKSLEVLAACHAAVRAGAIAVPLNPAWDQKTTQENLIGVDPTLILESGDRLRTSDIVMALDSNSEDSFSELAARHSVNFSDIARSGDDVAFIVFTSGTTNNPKGCALSHSNLVSNAEILSYEWQFSAEDLMVHIMPIYHTHGLLISTNVILAAGAGMIFIQPGDLSSAVQELARATSFMGIPSHFVEMVRSDKISSKNMPSMRLFVSGGAPLSHQVLQAFEAKTGHRILERYAMTEASVFVSNPYNGQRKVGTVGLPLPNIHLRITDLSTGEPLPKNSLGRVQIKGPNVFLRYWNDTEKTKNAFSEDGYFETGDVGRLDSDGYLEIAGRIQDMMCSTTGWVNARKIEEVLEKYPTVVEAAVIEVPVAGTAEMCLVAVVISESEAKANEMQIKQFLSDHLKPDEIPKRIVFAENLPRNSTGKLQKRLLRQSYANIFTVKTKNSTNNT